MAAKWPASANERAPKSVRRKKQAESILRNLGSVRHKSPQRENVKFSKYKEHSKAIIPHKAASVNTKAYGIKTKIRRNQQPKFHKKTTPTVDKAVLSSGENFLKKRTPNLVKLCSLRRKSMNF